MANTTNYVVWPFVTMFMPTPGEIMFIDITKY